ncbi:TetR/AcrR family transcriptional regulator [Fodinicola acaciae]|uniref:TetR/AcrR family transcriptional regulator n=1 Tax=Fodinicola acaciae TaxID=2681555 RepID=UPI001C9E2D26|nr:TetR/AcrR family transcriptional regulator [Fodinicola acaciae]
MRGRQAEAARNDRRLLEAAREVFASQGFDAPVSAVAERAGVGIGSLYRRYGSKTELLQRLCVLAMEQATESAEEGLRADDPWDGLAGHIRRSVAFQSGALGPLAGQIDTTPDMWSTSRRVRKLVDDLVRRAREAGALRPDVTALDVSLLIELFSRGGRAEPTAEDVNNRDRLLAISLDGLRVLDAGPLPGHPPWRSHYESPWRGPDRTDN